MFTGIVQAVGKVREPEKLGNGVRLTILAPDLGLKRSKRWVTRSLSMAPA